MAESLFVPGYNGDTQRCALEPDQPGRTRSAETVPSTLPDAGGLMCLDDDFFSPHFKWAWQSMIIGIVD